MRWRELLAWRGSSIPRGLSDGFAWFSSHFIGYGLSGAVAVALGWPVKGLSAAVATAGVLLPTALVARLTPDQAHYAGAVAGGVSVFLGFLVCGLLTAPYRQRDEDRTEMRRLGTLLSEPRLRVECASAPTCKPSETYQPGTGGMVPDGKGVDFRIWTLAVSVFTAGHRAHLGAALLVHREPGSKPVRVALRWIHPQGRTVDIDDSATVSAVLVGTHETSAAEAFTKAISGYSVELTDTNRPMPQTVVFSAPGDAAL